MASRLIIKLTGGVGNQLFQYAFGRAQSLRDARSLILDKRSYCLAKERALGRKFALDQFHIVTSEPSIVDLLYIRAMNARILGRFARAVSRSYIREETFEQDSYKLTHARPYVTGYWQSYKYFHDYRDQIRSELTFKTSVEGEPLAAMIRATGTSAVMLHIRRGDYLTETSHHLLGFDYYQRAVAHLVHAHPSELTVFVFTDDPDWARQNVRFDGVNVVIAADFRVDAERDLQLMTMCHHHVLANSTYSWWASYLCKAPGLCIAPRRWQAGMDVSAIDAILLPQWVRL